MTFGGVKPYFDFPLELRPYQFAVTVGVRDVWAQGGTPLIELPTGAGKTVIIAVLVAEHDGPAVIIAHRRELVGQLSLALAREGVVHKIIAPPATIRAIVRRNTEEVGRSYYSASAPVAVAGVDSIRNSSEIWRKSVTLYVIDEGHHPLQSNKWGRAIKMFPNAKGLAVTATPERADGKGLGVHAAGFYTHIVSGPSLRELIDAGYLSDYIVYAPESSLDLSTIKISQTTGDYVHAALQAAVTKAQITGDVIQHYLRIAPGRLGITFAVGVREAEILAAAYNAAGVPAAVVHAKTPDAERTDIIRRFSRRELLQLVNVDIFGEGFDLPAIEVVTFVRPTKSLPLYLQSFGRGLRIMKGKDHAIIIDHVGNVVEHGLPDAPRSYSLNHTDPRGKGPKGILALKVCTACARVFPRVQVGCPYCGFIPVPAQRSSPAEVDGDLVELNAETLAAMRGAMVRADMSPEEYAADLHRRGCPQVGIPRNVQRHRLNQEAQSRLRHAMDWWRGVQHAEGISERESYRRFYLTFDVDVLTARTLSVAEADDLCDRIRANLPFVAQCLSV